MGINWHEQDKEKILQEKLNQDARADKLRYIRRLKANNFTILEILNTEKVNRSEAESFYLRLYIQNNVPFFLNFEGDVVQKLFKKLDTHHFSKGQIIEKQGESSDLMYIILVGRVGMYYNEDLKACAKEISENNTFGMRFTQNDESKIRMTNIVAHVDTICMSLDFKSYNE